MESEWYRIVDREKASNLMYSMLVYDFSKGMNELVEISTRNSSSATGGR